MEFQQAVLREDESFSPPAPVRGARRIVWVPGERVLTLQLNIPGRHWRKALAYAVEPYLAQPIEQQQIIPLDRRADGETVCAVVAQAQLARWQDALEQYGWEDAALLPDYFSVPVGENWQRYSEQGRSRVRTGQATGFCAPDQAAETLAQQAQASLQAVSESQLTCSPELLRYKLAQTRSAKMSGSVWKSWAQVAAMLLLVVGVYLGEKVWQTQRLQQQAQAYQMQTEALFKQLFPEVKRIVNIRAQLKGKLKPHQAEINHNWAWILRQVQQAGAWVQAFSWQQGNTRLTVRAATQTALQKLEKIPRFKRQAMRKLDTGQWEAEYVVGA